MRNIILCNSSISKKDILKHGSEVKEERGQIKKNQFKKQLSEFLNIFSQSVNILVANYIEALNQLCWSKVK